MFNWVVVAFIFGSSQLLEGSLKFTFVCELVHNTDIWYFLQFSIKLEEWNRNKNDSLFFLGKKNGLSAIFYKKDLNWQIQFLNFLESFIIKFL